MPPKRTSTFKDEYEREFPGIKRSKKGEEFAHCIPCQADFSLLSMGKAAIPAHQKTDKHKNAAKAANNTKTKTAFLPSSSTPTNSRRKIPENEFRREVDENI